MSRSQSLAPKLSLAPGKANNRVTINVGGVRYETHRSTLKSIPDTRLAWVTNTTANNPDYDSSTGEYFFDRHPGVFNMILNYYRTGKLHAPTDVCGPLFEEELAFWGIDEKQIESCCWPNYRAHRDAQETLADFDNDNDDEDDDEDNDDDEIARRFGIVNDSSKTEKSWYERWRPKIWTLLEDPTSSPAATVFTVVTSIFVILSIASFCAETHTMFRYEKANASIPVTATVRDIQRLTEPFLFLTVFEASCMAFFTIDIILRLIFCPDKKEYVFQFLTVFDVMSVLPFYIRVILDATVPDLHTSDGLYFLNSLRLIMIVRILKLTRHFSGFKILGHTLKASAKELLLMILVLSIGVLTFSCLIYYAEQVEEDSTNDFKNIPRGFWWAVVTMTTLGYGDMFPRTALGYIVGAVCALCGLLMLALPVPVIVNNFTLYYSHAQAKLKLPKKARNNLVGAADALKACSDTESSPPSPKASISSISSLATKPTAAKDQKGNSEEMASVDSGYKPGSPQEDFPKIGISVIFTDETDDFSTSSSHRWSQNSMSGKRFPGHRSRGRYFTNKVSNSSNNTDNTKKDSSSSRSIGVDSGQESHKGKGDNNSSSMTQEDINVKDSLKVNNNNIHDDKIVNHVSSNNNMSHSNSGCSISDTTVQLEGKNVTGQQGEERKSSDGGNINSQHCLFPSKMADVDV